MANERLNEINAQLEVIRARLEEIQGMDDPTGDEEVVRAALVERNDEVDDLTAAWDELMAEREPLIERARRLDEVLQAAKDVRRTESGDGSRYLGGRGPAPVGFRDPFDTDLDVVRAGRARPEDVIQRAKRAIDGAPRYVDDEGRQYIMGVLDHEDNLSEGIARHMLLTGSPQYHVEFRSYLASGGRVVGPEIARALSLGSAAAGAALVPYTLDPTIILTNLGIVGSIRSMATVKQITTDAWHGVTSAGVTAEWLAESTASADVTPADFADPNIAVHKAHAWVVGSYESLADSNFAEQLSKLIADAKERLDEEAFATGSGSGQPYGIVKRLVATTASRVTSVTSGAFAAADVFNMSAAASPRHASRSVWFANKATYLKIRQFSTVTAGGTFWADMGVGQPSQLLGVGAYEASSMNSFNGATTTSNLLVLANPKEYYVVDRLGLQMKFVDVVFSTVSGTPIGQSGWEAHWRTGGDMVGPSASGRVFRMDTSSANWS
jgi:HK97 family phage major capsid protein